MTLLFNEGTMLLLAIPILISEKMPSSWHIFRFYPYHDGPFVSDLKGLSQIKIKFEKGSPLKPIENLMVIIPLRGYTLLLSFDFCDSRIHLTEFSSVQCFHSSKSISGTFE